MKARAADAPPAAHIRSARTRIWFVAQWGPVQDRSAPGSVPECFRTVRVDSLEEAMAVAFSGAQALNPLSPWVAGGRVSKVLFPTEAAPVETDRWLLVSADGGSWQRV